MTSDIDTLSTEIGVELEGVRFHAHHGVFESERKIGNDFTVWLSVVYRRKLGEIDDDLGGTISYADLYDLVADEMRHPSDLLENVAARIARRVSAVASQWIKIEIRIRKEAPPIAGMDGRASVSLKLSNIKHC